MGSPADFVGLKIRTAGFGGKVFAKLEIRSRAELARALPSSEIELAPA